MDTYDISYLEGAMSWDISVTKLEDGSTKASGHGKEAISRSQGQAIQQLEQQLEEAFVNGEIRPGM